MKLGYRALDIEYEWFLQGAKEKIDIKNKNVNEVGKPDKNIEFNDERYQNQIITTIQ